ENIRIQNVDFIGEALINLGKNAEVTGSSNWQTLECGQVLFVNFTANYTCEGALVEFFNTTEGPATNFNWTFDSLGSSLEESPFFVFPQEGSYVITLEASGNGKTMVYEKEISIGGNVLETPSIVTNGSLLTSLVPSSLYQWYRNGQKIEGAVERSYAAENDGIYQVAVVNESCNRISEPVVISGIADETPLARSGYFIGPNPASHHLTVTLNNDYTGSVEFEWYGTQGALLESY